MSEMTDNNYNYEREREPERPTFIGKRGEGLTVTNSYLVLERAKGTFLINLDSVGLIFKKSGRYFKVYLSSRKDVDVLDWKTASYLLHLKAEDTKKLIEILKKRT